MHPLWRGLKDMNHPTPALTVYLDGIGLVGPGLTDWASAAAILRGEQPYVAARTVLPAPASLPPAERRRASPIIKASLASGLEAIAAAHLNPADLATVFTSSTGDGVNCHEICQALASDDKLISPTRFHNSVHNAASGYWGISTGAMAPSSVLCAYDGCFGAGLLEAMTMVAAYQAPVALMSYDNEYPEPLHAVRPVPDTFGVALVFSPVKTAQSLVALSISPTHALREAPADTLSDAALENVRRSIPAARSLPLLQHIVQGRSGQVVLDYLPPLQLAMDVQPC